MNIILTGCSSPMGAAIRQMILGQEDQVFGVGLHGPDMDIDFLRSDPANMATDIFIAAQEFFQSSHIHCLINNAGITHMDWVEDHHVFEVMDVMKVNAIMPYALSRRLAINVANYDYDARIINMCSMAAIMPLRQAVGYCMSKAALEMQTKCLAKEFAGRLPITVVGISPGAIAGTPMQEYARRRLMETRNMDSYQAMEYSIQSPLGRNASIEEVVAIFKFAIYDMPPYCTGSILRMPGGLQT